MQTCPACHAVFDGRKWNSPSHVSRENRDRAEQALCTACKRIRDKVTLGTVYLDGEIIASRTEEILRMIRREEEIEHNRNYCSRILDIRTNGKKMTIRTVNSLLAIHIARQFKKAFKGRMEIFKDTPGHRPRNKQSEGTVAVKWIQSP